ncbi:hypothetical protein BX616_002318 [Lobosporangium transversale]
MTSTKGSTSSEKPTGFMSEYMSDLSQSQDLDSFLKKNQPTFDPNSHKTASASTRSTDTNDAPANQQESYTPSSTTTAAASSSSSSSSTSSKQKMLGSKISTEPSLLEHTIHQRKAIHAAALDNCADINMELTDCLMGRSGTWWDRASMCMKAKETLQLCCRLNKDILQEKGYAREGNTPEQDRAIMDYADDEVQKIMKEDKKT